MIEYVELKLENDEVKETVISEKCIICDSLIIAGNVRGYSVCIDCAKVALEIQV